jgi:hypothetical protein
VASILLLLAPSTFSAAMQQSLLSGFGGRQALSSMGELSTAEVPGYARDRLFDSAPQALCHAINR